MRRLISDLKLAAYLLLGITVVMVLLNMFMYNEVSWAMAKNQIFYNAYYGIPISIMNGHLFSYMDRRWPWENHVRSRAIFGSLASIIATMATVLLLNTILWVWVWGNDYSILFTPRNRNFYVIALIITVIISATLHAYFFLKQLVLQKEINSALESEKLKTELGALRSQLDPHFLFNSLNVLSGLIDEDKEKAQRFLSGLSGIFRYTLEHRDEDLVTLEKELEFAEKYLDLQAMRFENSIEMKRDIDEQFLSLKLPCLSLQLLLENAIKHNVFSADTPLVVELKIENDYLIVQNRISKRKNSQGSLMGLENIKNRYALLTDKEVIILEGPENFVVKLGLS